MSLAILLWPAGVALKWRNLALVFLRVFFGVQVKNKKWRFVWGNRELTPEDSAYGTVYSLNWLPLGGFVKIKGEDGISNDPDSFSSKPIWRRALVIAAGVFMNVVLAAALLSMGYMVGLPQMTDELPDNVTVQDRRVEIIQVLPGKPAEVAGVKDGDIIYKVGPIAQPRLKQMQDFVNTHKQEEITFVFKRGDQLLEKKLRPRFMLIPARAVLAWLSPKWGW